MYIYIYIPPERVSPTLTHLMPSGTQTWAPSQQLNVVSSRYNPFLSEVFPLALQVVSLFESIVAIAIVMLQMQAKAFIKGPSKAALAHQHRTLTALRSHILESRDSDDLISDGTAIAILNMCGFDVSIISLDRLLFHSYPLPATHRRPKIISYTSSRFTLDSKLVSNASEYKHRAHFVGLYIEVKKSNTIDLLLPQFSHLSHRTIIFRCSARERRLIFLFSFHRMQFLAEAIAYENSLKEQKPLPERIYLSRSPAPARMEMMTGLRYPTLPFDPSDCRRISQLPDGFVELCLEESMSREMVDMLLAMSSWLKPL